MRADIATIDLSSDALLEDWAWRLEKPHTVIAMNNFGDMFLRDENGTILLLNISWGTVGHIATSDAEFQCLAADQECARQWLLTDFLTQIERAGMALSSGDCFAFKKPLKLGGTVKVSNFEIASITVHVSLQGQILQQLRDLPPRTRIKEVTIE